MGYVRAVLASGFIALAGAGGGVIVANLHSSSPRLMTAGIVSAVIGILGGALSLGKLGSGGVPRG
jgi:hypothetical protein